MKNSGNTLDAEKVYVDALELWGIESQCMMAIEECNELVTSLLHKYRGREADVIGEIADVMIMMEQLSIIFGAEAVADAKAKKIVRLHQRILLGR